MNERSRRERGALAVTVSVSLFCLVLVGCGSSNGGNAPGVNAGAPSNTPIPSFKPVAAKTVAGSGSVTISASLYDASSPCASVTVTTPIYAAPQACIAAFAPIGATTVPGSSLLSNSNLPNTIQYGPGVSASEATQDATGEERTAIFETWAVEINSLKALSVLNPDTTNDYWYNAIKTGYEVISVPACSLPFRMEVVTLNASEQQTLQTSSPVAIVETFHPCQGVKTDVYTGKTYYLEGNSQTTSVVESGQLETVAPFGTIWVSTSSLACGTAAIAAACGGVQS